LTLLLLDLRRILTLNGVGYSSADILDVGFVNYYGLYWRVTLGIAIWLKGLFIRKINVKCVTISVWCLSLCLPFLCIILIRIMIFLLMTTDQRAYSLWRRQSSQASIWQRLQDNMYLRCLVLYILQTLLWRDPLSLVNLPLWLHLWFVCSSSAIATTRC
jgi:hypothetical protein